jgi:hypothetical protein
VRQQWGNYTGPIHCNLAEGSIVSSCNTGFKSSIKKFDVSLLAFTKGIPMLKIRTFLFHDVTSFYETKKGVILVTKLVISYLKQ